MLGFWMKVAILRRILGTKAGAVKDSQAKPLTAKDAKKKRKEH
jgi:hypothetical protein